MGPVMLRWIAYCVMFVAIGINPTINDLPIAVMAVGYIVAMTIEFK